MRPLRLKISGFGPYKSENEIDMESLGRGGLYLITGDTGAGKTFIFDAITYALYGEMSGSGRDSKSVRSQYSRDGEKTEVELEFEYCGRRYKVTRNPEYNRLSKRGEGFTKQLAGATLIKPDGSAVDGTSKVNEEIKNILGIDRGQFCSIAMIAQGEFRKVLNAGTDERQKLFRKLFDTISYSRLSEELKELNKRNRELYEDRIRSMRLSLSSVSCSFDGSLAESLKEMNDRSEGEAVMPDEICGLIGSVIEAGMSRTASVAEELTATEERITLLSNRIAIAENHRENVNNLEKAKGMVPELDAEIENAKTALDAANEKKPLVGKLENEAAVIEASLDAYDELDSISSELTELKKQQSAKEEELSAAGIKKETIGKKLAGSEELKEELRSCGEELLKISGMIESRKSRISALESLIRDIRAVDELSAELKRQQDELDPLITESERLSEEHRRMLSAYMREKAGILAGSLKDGEPCPVCGSIHHPSPAELSKEAPSDEDLKECEEKAEKARNKAAEMLSVAEGTKGKLKAMTESACAAALRETGSDDLKEAESIAENDIISLKGSVREMREEKKQLREKVAKAEKLESEIPELRRSLKEADEKVRELEQAVSALKESYAAAEAGFRQLRKDLAYDSREDAKKDLDAKTAQAKKLKDDIEEAAGALNDAESAKKVNGAKISELQRVVERYEPVDEEAAVRDAAAAKAEKDRLTDLSIQIASELKTARTALDSVRSGAEELEKIRRDHEIIDPLSKTANGALPGKERITLESYVQTFYFERIIRHANKRLSMMSDGQYEFVKSGGSGDKRSLSGLDLSVLDHYSGTERPVSTLSGGESFMASLSLALGLSDEVQSSAGGIRLDTMFVDEGFGSLDSETLEKAIRTLTELSDEDKLVGIISHVETLKSRIDRQIVVTKERDAGSRASVVI